MVADIETAKLRALAGQDDMFTTKALDFFPVAKQEESGGKIKVTRWAHSQYNMATIEFNLTAPDPVTRADLPGQATSASACRTPSIASWSTS